jgi:hypothetical protein
MHGMTQLQTLQTRFQDALLQDTPPTSGELSDRGVAQFGIYQTAYRARLRGALRDNFEVLPAVMGDDSFDALANAYILANPSRHYSLRWYGHRFCDFMANNTPLVDHPALIDLARMEWALRNAFDAPSAELLMQTDLATVPAANWAELRFKLHPSVQLLDFHWAVGPIWHALKSGATVMDPPEALDHTVIVWRHGMNTQWRSLTPTEAQFVKCLMIGLTFSDVCETLTHEVGEEAAAQVAVGDLRQLIVLGTICSF